MKAASLSSTLLSVVTPAGATSNWPATKTASERQLLDNWLNIQAINLTRHARSLRPFTKDEFGTSPAAPSEAHIEAVNRLIDRFRSQVVDQVRWVEAAASAARREPTAARRRVLLERKEMIGNQVLYVEGIWDFYFDLFVQRLSSFGERLRSIGLRLTATKTFMSASAPPNLPPACSR